MDIHAGLRATTNAQTKSIIEEPVVPFGHFELIQVAGGSGMSAENCRDAE